MDDSSDIGRPEIVVRQVVEGVHDLSTASLAIPNIPTKRAIYERFV